jgi:uncharacterized protein YodC (DUF2158 family)
MMQLQKGDKVQLKSGGQVMTLSNLGDYEGTDRIKDGALCVWFDKEGKVREKVFDVSVLEAVLDESRAFTEEEEAILHETAAALAKKRVTEIRSKHQPDEPE